MTFRSTVCLLASVVVVAGTVLGGELVGDVRVGGVFLDEEGHRAVNQPTYNTYEGAAVSLENLRYRMENGVRLFGNLENLTLNNRRLFGGATKAGTFGVTFRNNQYRRVYGRSGGDFTRRRSTSGDLWVQPHEYVRLFGGYGQTARHGRSVDFFEPFDNRFVRKFDYSQNFYHAGVRLKKERHQLTAEYRGSSFKDEVSGLSDMKTGRFRLTAASPIPRYEQVALSAGFQHYVRRQEATMDTLNANTFWASASYRAPRGFSLRYSLVFDRARRTGDYAATDNISNGVYFGKTWSRRGAVTVGYRHQINDDALDELSTNGYYFSGWVRPIAAVLVRAGYGSESTEVNQGRTLTGDTDYARHYVSVKYTFESGSRVRVKMSNRQTENDQIGSEAEYVSVASDLWLVSKRFGELQVSYSYLDGEYENSGGVFSFGDHVISGDLFPVEYERIQAGVGGTYVRSKDDLDVESFSVRLSGAYNFDDTYRFEIKYSAHNFDNLGDTSPIYSEYYTANIVELYFIRAF